MRKIFVVIERRSDYSRLRPVLMAMIRDKALKLHLVVTGLCLLELHGKGVDFIKQDGIPVAKEIPMYGRGKRDSGVHMVQGMSRLMRRIVLELEHSKPDIVMVGFDIGAHLATAIAAAHLNLPIVHIQGGELTGNIDESIRHATSKFAHYHMPATQLSKERLIRMGESPDTIFVVGCPSIDMLLQAPRMTKAELSQMYKIDFTKPLAILIQHPVTSEYGQAASQIKNTLKALLRFDLQVVTILPNNDAGYSKIIKQITKTRLIQFPNLSPEIYGNLLRHAAFLIGNSSSGLHEAPTFKVPVINIGTRQQGRERADNVIDVGYDTKEIVAAIEKVLYDNRFKKKLESVKNPYGDGHASEKIIKGLKTIKLTGIIQKRFFDGE